MTRLYVVIILLLLYFPAKAQVEFNQIPYDLQLFPRDVNNQAEVIFSGKINTLGYTKIGLQTLRQGIIVGNSNQNVTPNNITFQLRSSIKAELAEYSFRVFLYKDTDSTLVTERKRILCGDVYLFYGQSNALALHGLDTTYADLDDTYLRTCSFGSPKAPSTSDIAWHTAKHPSSEVGGIGLTLQRNIQEKYGIPTCVINGASGGYPLYALIERDPNNHANLSTMYGQLLYRAQWANVAKQAKGIIWRQGEAEAGSSVTGYENNFATLYNQLREDYGNVRLYVAQLNIMAQPNDGAAVLRNYQRRNKFIFNNLETIATVGTPGYDGIHYSPKAYQQLAFEQFRQIARDVYGEKDTLQINSPDIKKVFYNVAKDSITLVFDEGATMVWKSDTTLYDTKTGSARVTRYQKDVFSLDGNPWWVTEGSAIDNRIILHLLAPARAKTIRYLPAYFSDNVSDFYDGPTLRNTRGMRAFSFDNVPIADAIPAITTLVATSVSDKQINLSWNAQSADYKLFLERADGSTNFVAITTLAGNTSNYNDTNLPDPFGTYHYRLRIVSNESESPYSNIATARPLILGVEPVESLVRVYPNPVMTDQPLAISADQLTFSNLSLYDVLGRRVKSWNGAAKSALSIAVNDLTAGTYVLELQTPNGYIVRQKIIIRN